MALFLINARDKANSRDLRAKHRPAHLAWANTCKHRITLAGPIFTQDGETMIGSTFIIAFDTLAEAKSWTAEDPYTKAGLFESVEVVPFKWLLGEGKRAHG